MMYPKGAWQQQEATKVIRPYQEFQHTTGLRFKDLKEKRVGTARAMEEGGKSPHSDWGSVTAVPTDIYLALLDVALEYFAVAAMLLDEPEDS